MRMKELNRKDIFDSKTFGEFCRACRKTSRLSQTEVGEMIGYSGNHISDFERGYVDSCAIQYFYAIYFGATLTNYIYWCMQNQVEIFTKELKGCFMRNREYRREIQSHQDGNSTEQLYNIACFNEMNMYYDIKTTGGCQASEVKKNELSTTNKTAE